MQKVQFFNHRDNYSRTLAQYKHNQCKKVGKSSDCSFQLILLRKEKNKASRNEKNVTKKLGKARGGRAAGN